MPMYTFACKDCGTSETEFVHNYDNLAAPICPNCGKIMGRDLVADSFHTPKDSYDKPIHSDALAVSPLQKEEHERLFPYIKLDEKCRPIFDNYKDHQRYLDETGHFKARKKNRRRATRIS